MQNPMPLYVNYKDIAYLKQFLTPHARVQGKRRTKVPAFQQRKIDEAIKRARFMALLPYVAE
ncbi:30S ribosomal protein S18 [Patescibacteria group bacterium]|nr:30S ribosomal protein S18 [Patescibacteria group bacterium]